MLPMLKPGNIALIKNVFFLSFSFIRKKKNINRCIFLFNFGNIGKLIKRVGIKAFIPADVGKNQLRRNIGNIGALQGIIR